jgi:hypothetical protein
VIAAGSAAVLLRSIQIEIQLNFTYNLFGIIIDYFRLKLFQ